MAKIAVLPSAIIANAFFAAFEQDGARGAKAEALGGLDAMLEQLAALLAIDALGDTVLVPRWAIYDAQAPLCKRLVANLGETCVVLALEKVPPFLLSGAWTEVKIFASADGVESVLNAKLLDVAGTFLVAVHARSSVLGMLPVDSSNIRHGEASLCVDAVEHFIESGFACECVWTSRHNCEGNIDSLEAQRIV